MSKHAPGPSTSEETADMNLTEILCSHAQWLRSGGTEGARANLCGANLHAADLRTANLRGADLGGVDLNGAKLRRADLGRADLSEANLCRANLRGANLRGADLNYANLRRADLRGADLRFADLRDADLRGAKLCDANLRGADLRGADLRDAGLVALQLPMWTAYVQITGTRIGCQYHANDEWRKFSDEQISAMDDEALEWWMHYKHLVFAAMDAVEGEKE